MRRAMLLLLVAVACATPPTRPGDEAPRTGDEISVCGRLFHTGTRVVLWNDPGGFDHYRVEPKWPDELPPDLAPELLEPAPRYSWRSYDVPDAVLQRAQRDNWALDSLRTVVDQVVLHYDVCGTSRRCFQVLHDERHLSIHFMLDVDGTIYQALDLKEKAWHATKANSRSIGIEIAQIGAYESPTDERLTTWYAVDDEGPRLTLPEGLAAKSGFAGRTFRPARDALLSGEVNGRSLWQYDFTDAQYEALEKLVAALHRVFPSISLSVPRDPTGGVLRRALGEDEFRAYRGLLGHDHVQENKVDPGPAFDWERVLTGANKWAGGAGGLPSGRAPGSLGSPRLVPSPQGFDQR